MLTGNVLITGGAGFLGRGFFARARRENWSWRPAVLSRDDAKHAALQRRYPEVHTIVGDVGLETVDMLTTLMLGFDTVIHAAAWKYVDRAEAAAFATVQTNIIGSANVARAAMRARVPRVIGVSTDKAVQPVNNYGATKLMMERLFQEADRLGETTFNVVRYGNVIGSTGSVIPMFMAAVEEEKPVRLTDPAMTRFWMSVDEAIDLILYALRSPKGGEVIIPNCRALSMKDLVRVVLGYNEHGELPDDGRVEIIGIRPGEKRHEALMHKAESVRARREGTPPFIHLSPPDTPITNVAPWEITSDNPPGGQIGIGEMRVFIEQAAEV